MRVEKSVDWWDSVQAMQKVIGHYPVSISAGKSDQDFDIFFPKDIDDETKKHR